jgi:hypothetical protein
MMAALLIVGIGLCASMACGQKGEKPVTTEDQAIQKANDALVAQWLTEIYRAEPRFDKPLTFFMELSDGERVEQDSRQWAGTFFTLVANPFNQSLPVRLLINPARQDSVDVLRHQYAAAGKTLKVDETANVILITVDEPFFLMKSEEEKHAAINAAAALLLNVTGTMVANNLADAPYQWTFEFPARIVEGTHFSTNPLENPSRMWSWAMRLDGGIHDGRLYFLAFKQREQTSGRLFILDGQHWFDGKCWDVLRR